MKLNRNKLRRMIKESLNELTLVKSGNPTPSEVEMLAVYPVENGRQGPPTFIFTGRRLPYQRMTARMDNAGEVLNSLIQAGVTQININPDSFKLPGEKLPYDTLIDDDSPSGKFDDFGYEY